MPTASGAPAAWSAPTSSTRSSGRMSDDCSSPRARPRRDPPPPPGAADGAPRRPPPRSARARPRPRRRRRRPADRGLPRTAISLDELRARTPALRKRQTRCKPSSTRSTPSCTTPKPTSSSPTRSKGSSTAHRRPGPARRRRPAAHPAARRPRSPDRRRRRHHDHPPTIPTPTGPNDPSYLLRGAVVSPILANLFMHYAFDTWMAREIPSCPFERYADDAVVHCKSRKQAEYVLGRIAARLGEVGLRLHPDKTRIVYCKDGRRRDQQEHVSFTFLGYAFRARGARTKDGGCFTSFLPRLAPRR